MELAPHKQILTVAGNAAGKINRLSHVVFVCRDMDETVWFYRDILGLKIVGTSGKVSQAARDSFDSNESGQARKRIFSRQYFFQLGDGEVIGFYEVPDAPDARAALPLVNWIWPGTSGIPPEKPFGCDHIALNVDTVEDVNWFKERLIAHGTPVFGPVNPKPGSPVMFTHRIYFFDPSGNALEIATQNMSDPMWQQIDETYFFSDTEPVPQLKKGR